MGDNIAAPVVAGLAVGIAFVIAFSIGANTSFLSPISDIELQSKVEQTKEVKAFLSKYPDANVQFHQGADGKRTIDYFVSTMKDSDGDGVLDAASVLTLGIVVDKITGKVQEMTIACSGSNIGTIGSRGIMPIDGNIPKFIEERDCV